MSLSNNNPFLTNFQNHYVENMIQYRDKTQFT